MLIDQPYLEHLNKLPVVGCYFLFILTNFGVFFRLIIGGACTTIVFLVIYVNFSDQSTGSRVRHLYLISLIFHSSPLNIYSDFSWMWILLNGFQKKINVSFLDNKAYNWLESRQVHRDIQSCSNDINVKIRSAIYDCVWYVLVA